MTDRSSPAGAGNAVTAHYDDHLAPVYSWSVGGADAAIAEGARWLATLPLPAGQGRVLDLGAGFGATAIPLARAGHRVVAVDTSAALLGELAELAEAASVACVHGDLVAAVRDQPAAWDLILCVGDTLPHLASHAEVEELLAALARGLTPGGVAVLAYRPRRELAPDARFVLVHADARRTRTAFLEPIDDDHQRVWDVIHEHEGETTTMKVSSYPKLRIEPGWLAERAVHCGLAVAEATPYRGMVVQVLRRRA